MNAIVLEVNHAMQMAVLNQKMQEELFGEADTTLVMLEIRMKSLIASEHVTAFGVECAGLLAGFCLTEKTSEGISVTDIFVTQEDRRQGIGTMLIDTVHYHHGVEEILLPSVNENSAGELFYCSFE